VPESLRWCYSGARFVFDPMYLRVFKLTIY
jgi:hypothetical protein